MSSILTNAASMAALQTLRSISNNMETTQGRISSGLRVGAASDNAAYWSIATTMRSDNSALSAVQDALGLGAAKVDTAYAGMESVIEVVKEIKNKLITAQESSADKAKIQGEITQLQQQLGAIVENASFSGENWLKGVDGATKTVVGSFVREGGSVSVKTIDYEVKALISDDGTSGILDKAVQGPGTARATLQVNIGGEDQEFTVKTYTVDELLTAGVSFANGVGTVATGATAEVVAGSYAKLDDDTWVKVVADADKEAGQAAFYDSNADGDANAVDADDLYYIDTANTAPTTDQPMAYSIKTLNITATGFATDFGNDFNKAVSHALTSVDAALTELTSAAAQLGSISMRVGLQEDFASKLSDAMEKGIGRLVDADMNEESTRLKALQTQQQLAIQALSIANSDSQNILSLFR